MGIADSHGNPTSASNPEALRHLDTALDCFLFFRGSMPDAIQAALETDPHNALAQAFNAYLGVLGTESAQAKKAKLEFATFVPQQPNEREQMHLHAAAQLLHGDFFGAGQTLHMALQTNPRDMLALAVGHQIDFFTGNSRMLQTRPTLALAALTQDDPFYGNALGMLAFGLEETHQHDHALEAGLAAVAHNPKDVWALHAVGHTFEEMGRFGDGVRFFDARHEHWTQDNYFLIHNWWHYALFLLEAGDVGRVLQIFDAALFNQDNGGLALQILDASALLWRLKLEGVDVGMRFVRLAEKWKRLREPAFYAFNDMHMQMAFVGAGLLDDAETVIQSREAWLAGLETSNSNVFISNVAMTRNIGLPICKAILAFGRDQHSTVVDLLHPIRQRIHEFGGSHAQRDVVLKTLIESGLRAGRFEISNAMLQERLAVRPRSPYNWQKHAQALHGLGNATQAAMAEQNAKQRVLESGLLGPP